MKFIEDLFYENIGKKKWMKDCLSVMQKEVDEFYSSFSDDPSHLSGWGHRYFCSDCGGRLVFDLKKPHEHICSVCGKREEGKVYDEAWVVFYRNLAFVTAQKSAVLFKTTGERKYLDIVNEILSFYALHFLDFPLHTKEGVIFSSNDKAGWGCGRIMPQGLNESILMVRAIETLEILKGDLDRMFLEKFHEVFVKNFYPMIIPQVNKVHNIPCWYLAALGMASLFFQDRDVMDFVRNSEFNIDRQLREGVTADGFWYEGSIHYNFFLLEGIVTLYTFSKMYGVSFSEESERTIERMLVAAYNYAFDNQRFPNPNDGWPDVNLKTYSYIYYMFAKVSGENSVVGNLLKAIESSNVPRQTLPLSESYYINNTYPIERLLFAYDWDMANYRVDSRKSAVYPASCFAMLRSGELNLFFKYGLNGPSHAHPDILEFELMYGQNMVSRDLSNAGYHSNKCITWHRKSSSHNTIAVNGQNISAVEPGKILSYDDNSVRAEAKLFEGIYGDRSFHITDRSLQDKLNVSLEEEGTVDLFFHVEPAFQLSESVDGDSCELGYRENGYEYFEDVKRLSDRSVFTFSNGVDSFTVDFNLEDGQELYLMTSPDNPVTKKRTTFLRRKRGKIITFEMKIIFKEQ